MLNLEMFRVIKPIGSIDDYTAGDIIGCTRAEAGEQFLESLLIAIKSKSMSVPQLSKLTGRSRTAISRRLTTQKNKGNVTVTKIKQHNAQKPVNFYRLTECAA